MKPSILNQHAYADNIRNSRHWQAETINKSEQKHGLNTILTRAGYAISSAEIGGKTCPLTIRRAA